jgi:hypothetical protein
MYYTPETLLNYVFEDLRKPKAPNNDVLSDVAQLKTENSMLKSQVEMINL